ncbi:cysteine dioxygenase family protein [Kordiimonas aquimaris]|uniref:cysteine dioxygenase family protein n=1 Tax=Kordiimonas aquimaris TaxID=707591 RepID=UPI0021D00266|nr:cysteine dioxygenase family protein [Kordiimonas aquimaris]
MDGAFYFESDKHLSRLIDETSNVTRALDGTNHRITVASLLRLALPHVEKIELDNSPINENGYSRHMIYADPAGRFSIIAVKWMPGACTPVHGHNAWGCVGVVNGEIGCETYEHKNGGCPEGYEPEKELDVTDLVSTGKIIAGPGKVASVEPDPCGIHRIFNPTNAPATTLHIYGMNLSENPDGLNKWYER